jgi:hypothetical protein
LLSFGVLNISALALSRHQGTMPVVTPEKLASLQRQSQDIRNVSGRSNDSTIIS